MHMNFSFKTLSGYSIFYFLFFPNLKKIFSLRFNGKKEEGVSTITVHSCGYLNVKKYTGVSCENT